MSTRTLTAEVTGAHGDVVRSEVAADLAFGGHKVLLTADAYSTKAVTSWLVPSEARKLIVNLMAQVKEAEARNLDMYGDKDGPAS